MRPETLKIISDSLTEVFRDAGVGLTGTLRSQLIFYLKELLAWNERVNLTGLSHPGDLAVKHIGDSLTLLPYLPAEARSFMDIGTGAGIPGLVIKLIRPELEAALIDARRKRVSFLRYIILSLQLEGVCVEQARIRAGEIPRDSDAGPERCLGPARFDVVMSRAVGSLPALASMAGPYLTPGGMTVAMKGPAGKDEVQRSRAELVRRGWMVSMAEVALPVSGDPRTLVFLEPGPGD